MMNKTECSCQAHPEDESEAFKYFAEGLGETRARILRKMIRESINGVPELLYDEAILANASHSKTWSGLPIISTKLLPLCIPVKPIAPLTNTT